jgi:hypothetical protein
VACTPSVPRQQPLGSTLPVVRGQSLDGVELTLPGDLAGVPTLLLVGYRQESQFDIDRWLLGLRDAGIEVRTYELPTIPGLVPGLFAERIDAGMRSGIPAGDWPAVITIYDDADVVVRFLGNENPLPARVLLLDAEGRVVFFHDEGYAIAALEALRAAVSRLER